MNNESTDTQSNKVNEASTESNKANNENDQINDKCDCECDDCKCNDDKCSNDIKQDEDKKLEIKKLKDQLLRTVAELQNVQKRAEKERTDMAKFAITQFAKDILSIFDSLQLALTNCKKQDDPIVEGIKLTLSQLNKVFDAYGIKMIESKDKKFDPNYHQAINQIESEKEKGTIITVLQEGFMIKDRLLRPALVSVAK